MRLILWCESFHLEEDNSHHEFISQCSFSLWQGPTKKSTLRFHKYTKQNSIELQQDGLELFSHTEYYVQPCSILAELSISSALHTLTLFIPLPDSAMATLQQTVYSQNQDHIITVTSNTQEKNECTSKPELELSTEKNQFIYLQKCILENNKNKFWKD